MPPVIKHPRRSSIQQQHEHRSQRVYIYTLSTLVRRASSYTRGTLPVTKLGVALVDDMPYHMIWDSVNEILYIYLSLYID